MKKITLALSALLLSTTFAQAQISGTFNITGTIIKTSECEVKADSITLNPINIGELKQVGQPTTWSNTNSAITFSNCYLGIGEGQSTAFIELELEGNPASKNDVYWDSTTNENVGIEIEIAGQKVPGSGTVTPISSPEITSNDTVTKFVTKARVARIAEGEIIPGPISTTVNFTASYK
ncbi:fimbrial protein [Ignatzschineria rhizosphaerae]|uniref:Fimbrial protein n=1 Tax=Ignatzschineria rhizosphaerae TaxID=2923279 RepID=A0ABY3X5G4_9GAMM|nr:fimbrial protein [Ignatzschineria rhizosphaerae]UNM97011.1 fimbrial protein [Ignatzschineria rhizosphaerae]